MKTRRRFFKDETPADHFWPAFTDMISTFILIMFMVVLIAFVQNIVTGNNLEYARKQLMDTESKLESSKAEISQAENQLRLLEDALADTLAEIERGQIALKLSEAQIDQQSQIIAESNQELGNLRSKLQGIALLRLDVLSKVKASVEKEMGATNDLGEALVLIGDNGNIIINEGLLFDRNQYTLKNTSHALLDQLASAFQNVLSDPNTRINIDSIVIQGHADVRGDGDANRLLAARRANAVVNYMFESNQILETRFGSYFASSSYSEFRPINTGVTEAAHAQNRRIEIAIVLKDSNVQDVINDYLKEAVDFLNLQVDDLPQDQ